MTNEHIKFPLIMKNGVQVRSVEELRNHADIESVMKYYFSGHLNRWCMALDMAELSEQFESTNVKFVKSILSSLHINDRISESDILRYVYENFGANTVFDIVSDVDEHSITDDKTIKGKLLLMVGDSINLDDYLIEVVPIKAENGNIQKYRVCISNEKNDQYSSFSVPYKIDKQYTFELFENDMIREIKIALDSLEKTLKFNRKKIEVGETFYFGHIGDDRIKWRILKNENNFLYAITTECLCNRTFDRHSNNWWNSEIRKWLNCNFYNSSFTADEKKMILTVDSDNVSLLSKDEVEQLMPKQERNFYSWWLRSSYPRSGTLTWAVNIDGTLSDHSIHSEEGVRPVLILNNEAFFKYMYEEML
ncbi:DUF6273 domain-containing protein [Ruminococcus sp. HUN007]|uniref:DUF6273 domain-containing protein n=1 Tax=Ruminococcus sp. HUN007 TaxID=1514668 RepID=UPI0005D1B855|nr:DUF6273 domain-containing protein [Ruminococcus sp. HUN007]